MDKKVEKLAKEIFDECKGTEDEVTMEEAMEMAKMELGAKEIKSYTQSDKPKEKKKREVKMDELKVRFIRMLHVFIYMGGMDFSENITDVTIANPQKEITFRIGADEFSLTLTKHRPPKK